MRQLKIDLYYRMTEMLSEYRDQNVSYPVKFVLNDAQFAEYLQNIDTLGKELGKALDPRYHMGVDIGVDAGSNGFMLVAEGKQLPIR